MRLRDALLCLALDSLSLQNKDIPGVCGAAIAGGTDIVRLNVGGIAPDEAEQIARAVLAVCRRDDALLVIVDDPTLARTIEADGVHMSDSERPVGESRSFAGMDSSVGM
ncbi:MAG: hypothetical protein E4H02_12335, partial [Lentisphaerales bacterium]